MQRMTALHLTVGDRLLLKQNLDQLLVSSSASCIRDRPSEELESPYAKIARSYHPHVHDQTQPAQLEQPTQTQTETEDKHKAERDVVEEKEEEEEKQLSPSRDRVPVDHNDQHKHSNTPDHTAQAQQLQLTDLKETSDGAGSVESPPDSRPKLCASGSEHYSNSRRRGPRPQQQTPLLNRSNNSNNSKNSKKKSLSTASISPRALSKLQNIFTLNNHSSNHDDDDDNHDTGSDFVMLDSPSTSEVSVASAAAGATALATTNKPKPPLTLTYHKNTYSTHRPVAFDHWTSKYDSSVWYSEDSGGGSGGSGCNDADLLVDDRKVMLGAVPVGPVPMLLAPDPLKRAPNPVHMQQQPLRTRHIDQRAQQDVDDDNDDDDNWNTCVDHAYEAATDDDEDKERALCMANIVDCDVAVEQSRSYPSAIAELTMKHTAPLFMLETTQQLLLDGYLRLHVDDVENDVQDIQRGIRKVIASYFDESSIHYFVNVAKICEKTSMVQSKTLRGKTFTFDLNMEHEMEFVPTLQIKQRRQSTGDNDDHDDASYFDESSIHYFVNVAKICEKTSMAQSKTLRGKTFTFDLNMEHEMEFVPTLQIKQRRQSTDDNDDGKLFYDIELSLECEHLPAKIDRCDVLMNIMCICHELKYQKIDIFAFGIDYYKPDGYADLNMLNKKGLQMLIADVDLSRVEYLRFKMSATVLHIEYDPHYENFSYTPRYNRCLNLRSRIAYTWPLSKHVLSIMAGDTFKQKFYSPHFHNEYWCLSCYKHEESGQIIVCLNLLRLPAALKSIECETQITLQRSATARPVCQLRGVHRMDIQYNNCVKFKVSVADSNALFRSMCSKLLVLQDGSEEHVAVQVQINVTKRNSKRMQTQQTADNSTQILNTYFEDEK
eukprot:CAMPEP_0202728370 /NCGR_PEP_ID=MMETSP1385-20130828/185591_1 /ASSEMBLY_ACC=CAM_ASM_000861 /TAXON_ID=933848 /ORGANISM="Elphidium margaritaceum" /LENGTH=884 /DNA_ID=CAMNT_0049394617 /DNA_START=156 /DNA_END=2811 /DNA_ORIENTATION=-